MAEQRYYILDEFLLKLQPSQRYSRIIYFNFKRDNQTEPFCFKSLKMLYVGLTIIISDCLCNVLKIASEIQAKRLSEAKQIGAVWSIECLCIVRGISLMFKHQQMLELTNDLDQIFPKTLAMQQRMNCEVFARYLLLRHRVLYLYAVVGLLAFTGIPLLKYALFYDASSGASIPDEYHQHASWFPFHMKQNPRTYPYLYVWETFITIFGINSLFTWDHIYTVSVAQFIMHFEFVNSELEKLNARDSMNRMKRNNFYKNLKSIIKYHQHVLRLATKLRNTFNLSLFLTDLVSGASICFHFYLMANSDDFIAIILFIFPCFVQIAFTFDNCYQGSRIEEATSKLRNILFGQNWYDGSLKYRRILRMLLQFASRPFTISGFNLFSIDMVHFRGTMMMAYRMFTFLQACSSKNA